LKRFAKRPPAALLAWLILSAPPAAAQEAMRYSLPNGLEVRARHIAGAGTVRARLVFSVREGGAGAAPAGTAFLMSRTLPLLGAGGMGRAAFEAQKDQSGALSNVDAGAGWISWTFESLPANAEMMIQLLADESLRPAWLKSDALPKILAKAWEADQSSDAREDAVRGFRMAAGDAAAGRPPEAPIDQDTFVALWSAAIRRPESAVLSIVGDIESIPLMRAVAQHFGPWEGVGAKGGGAAAGHRKGEKRIEHIARTGAPFPEVWVAWDLDALQATDAEMLAAMIPWLLRTPPPVLASSQTAGCPRDIEIDPGGRWIRAVGHGGADAGAMESGLMALLAAPITQDRLDAALAAMDEHAMSSALHPQRALEQLERGPRPAAPAAPEELSEMLGKCMAPGNLTVLVVH
jgi:hypothetical protein